MLYAAASRCYRVGMFPSRRFVCLAALAFLPSLSPAAPKSVTPADHFHSPPEIFWQGQLDAKHSQPVDLLFIGDSITQGWVYNGKADWNKYYAPRAINFGISGDTTQNVLWRFEHLDLHTYHPKVAIILIGTNNTADTPEDIATGVKAVVDKTRQTFPDSKVILQSILPNARATEKMAAANEIIKTFADGRDVLYLDLAAQFPPEGDNWKGLLPDKLHLTSAGYDIWTAALYPILSRFVKIEQPPAPAEPAASPAPSTQP